jgi:outer membrane protein
MKTVRSQSRAGVALAVARGAGRPLQFSLVAFAIVAPLLAGPASAQTVRLTAEAAAARAVEVSHLAAAAGARLSASQETVKAADAAALPSLLASATVTQRSSAPEFAAPINGPLQPAVVLFPDITTTYGAGLRLQQALYAGGGISGLRAAARHDAEASAAGSAQTVADLRLAAQLAYWETVRSAANVEVARANRERAQRLLADTRALLDAGMAVKADVLAADERIASARLDVIVAESSAGNALTQLRSLLKLDGATQVELADSLTGPPPSPVGTIEELQGQALARRPEIVASVAQIAALRSRQELARAEARPSLGAVAQWEYSRPNQRYFPQTDTWNDSWSVGLLGSWTLFDGGKARADIATSEFAQRAAVQEREELQRRILLEVETERRNLASALAAVVAADAAHAAGVEREKAARERHAAGLAPMVEILDAEAQLASAEQRRVDARAGSWMAAAALARAVGQ